MALLALHEVLFDLPAGAERDRALLQAIRLDYDIELALLLAPSGDGGASLEVHAESGEDGDTIRGPLGGNGLAALLEVHRSAPGALTLMRVRRPSAFDDGAWQSLWRDAMGERAKALLSVELRSERAPRQLLWLAQTSHSRDWDSHDRQLAEEIADLLGRAADKALD